MNVEANDLTDKVTVHQVGLGAEPGRTKSYLDHVWEHLLPSLGGGTEIVEDAHPHLVERLRTLRLPPCPGTPSSPGSSARW